MTVVGLADRVTALESSLFELKQQLARHLVRVRNVAAQVLLVAAAGFRDAPDKCRPFQQLSPEDSSVQALAAALGIAGGRSGDVHTMDEAVEEVVCYIDSSMQQQAKWECLVVLGYERIKAAARGRFEAASE
ncbi:hypothetical protein TSOC_005689 [Tetrabaena socialis]|uniref:Uncharacterized protein n=1 Tax=Tetrabaena socialis TaxID=47790 RepID=A0A2J8A5P2_9CHLO|nr:hypothetical protein TSOC_005689 [Tetrabaena socialis]|eukprot:PNH07839.1 hypothetical protein TSOC_005689 [Tetrabaena socialis]